MDKIVKSINAIFSIFAIVIPRIFIIFFMVAMFTILALIIHEKITKNKIIVVVASLIPTFYATAYVISFLVKYNILYWN